MSSQPFVIPNEPVAHGSVDELWCPGCGRLAEISWGDKQVGMAVCACGWRFAYKHQYEKFVPV